MIRNWKTSLAGLVAIVIAIGHCVSDGMVDLNCIYQVIVGAGLLSAKDSNVSGK